MKQTWRRALLGGVAAAVASLAMASSASAGVLVKTTTDCDAGPLSQPFTPWLDYASYELAPGGTFEGGASGWDLNNGARVVSGNESRYVNSRSDDQSLRLPSGSDAVSAPICVGLEHPTVRFFAKKNSGLLSTLSVSAILQLQAGGRLEVPVGVMAAGGSWTPSLPYLFLGNLLPLLPGQYTPVSFRFRPLLGGDWQVDDVYVDPWRSR